MLLYFVALSALSWFSRTLVLLTLGAGLSFLVGCSSSEPLPSASSDNPLPECPDTPNCERISQGYEVPADSLFATAQTALEMLSPTQIRLQPDSLRASAVYRVALVFKDDVHIAVDSREPGSVLHVRSASRVGHSDLGVNQRRVQRLLHHVDDELSLGSETGR